MYQPICSTCKDTHRMEIYTIGNYDEVQTVMCTGCPVPCQKCRAGGIGPYCEQTPCACSCHEHNFMYRKAKKKAATEPTWISCKCGRHRRTVSTMWPAPKPNEIFVTGCGGYEEERYEEKHSIKRCIRYETVVKELLPE